MNAYRIGVAHAAQAYALKVASDFFSPNDQEKKELLTAALAGAAPLPFTSLLHGGMFAPAGAGGFGSAMAEGAGSTLGSFAALAALGGIRGLDALKGPGMHLTAALGRGVGAAIGRRTQQQKGEAALARYNPAVY